MPAMTDAAQTGGRAAAFFDLDGTMIPFNSALKYARFEHRAKRIKMRHLVRSAVWLLLYRFSLADMNRAFKFAVEHYKGEQEQQLFERTQSWFEAEVAPHLLTKAADAVTMHGGKGHPCVLLSSTSSYMARSVLARWGLDDWLANVFPTDADGALTGDFESPLCYGEGKVVRARRWAAENGVDLAKSWFYSDSYSDVPMLAAVGYPIVVNPDPRLRRHARKRGWPIELWTTP
ncbi:MAG: HAD superfamily hydrolase (TIGR01490 family) [Myxococcota bacterium]|jgi:HAD superfamily hydrolase (TIGR01490 family)